MSGVVLAIVWLATISLALAACSLFERRGRLGHRPDRPELMPPRALWGGGRVVPPGDSAAARALAAFARIVRRRRRVADHRPGLRFVGRVGALASLAIGLSLLPFAGTWGGDASDPGLLLLDLPHGLAAIVLLLLLHSSFRVTIGLAERNAWSRIGSVRQASRAIAAVALMTLVLAPIALGSDSLRLQDLAVAQQRPIASLAGVLEMLGGGLASGSVGVGIPAWNLFTQPLTALLFAPAMTLMLGSGRVDDPVTGAVGTAGLGLDADPIDAYWFRLDARLSLVLAAALFVTLFLGAGSIPFVDLGGLASALSFYAGEFLPRLLIAGLHLGSFIVKSLVVLVIAMRLKRVIAAARADRSLRLVTRRLLPLAWANLLLVAALTLWLSARTEGGVG
jgi:NADH:ubiquinone oxidoreductase subunit H